LLIGGPAQSVQAEIAIGRIPWCPLADRFLKKKTKKRLLMSYKGKPKTKKPRKHIHELADRIGHDIPELERPDQKKAFRRQMDELLHEDIYGPKAPKQYRTLQEVEGILQKNGNDYNELLVPELKLLLRERELKVGGKKGELCQRLQDDDNNRMKEEKQKGRPLDMRSDDDNMKRLKGESQKQMDESEWFQLFDEAFEFRKELGLTLVQFLHLFECPNDLFGMFHTYLLPEKRHLVPSAKDKFGLQLKLFLRKFSREKEAKKNVNPIPASGIDIARDEYLHCSLELHKIGCVEVDFDQDMHGFICVKVTVEPNADKDIVRKQMELRLSRAKEFKFEFREAVYFCNPSCVMRDDDGSVRRATGHCFKPCWAVTAYHFVRPHNNRTLHLKWCTQVHEPTNRFLTNAPFTDARFEPRDNSLPDLDVAFVHVDARMINARFVDEALDWSSPPPNNLDGLTVFKYGVASGRTFGVIHRVEPKHFVVRSLLSGPFAFFGDSGAVVYSSETRKVLGIVIGDAGDLLMGHLVTVRRYESFFREANELDADGDVEMVDV
jgi:hypothetical protein